MKGSPNVIHELNNVLANELVAINQYFLHAKMLKDWGLTKIADFVYKESIDEMKHAEMLTDRILFLSGLPNLQDLGKLRIGQTVKEMLECDLKLEEKAIPDIKQAMKVAEKEEDFGTRDMLQDILSSEEEHVDWIETQLDLLKRVGEENYAQSQM